MGIVFLKLKESFSNIRWGLIRDGDTKRSDFGWGGVMDVLPPTGFSFVEPEGFKGVGRDDRNKVSGALLTI